MRCLVILLVIVGGIAVTARGVVEKDKTATTQELKAAERADRETRTGQIDTVGPLALKDVIHLEVKDRRVIAKTSLPFSDNQRRVLIEGENSFCTLAMAHGALKIDPENPPIQLVRADFSDPSLVLVQTEVLAHPGYLQFAVAWEHTEEHDRHVTLLDQGAGSDEEGNAIAAQCDLHVQEISEEGGAMINLSYSAADLATLQREHPSEVNAYLRPALREIKSEKILAIDPKVAWEVFGKEKQPDPKINQTIADLLPQLDAQEYSRREAAAEALKKLGAPGAVALMHVDRAKLSAEQNARLDEILSNFQQLGQNDASALANKTDFLLDCLGSEDLEIRKAALKRLSEKVGKPVAFDPAAPADKRELALEMLRKQLLPPPATQATNDHQRVSARRVEEP